jgi:hypothetical protein
MRATMTAKHAIEMIIAIKAMGMPLSSLSPLSSVGRRPVPTVGRSVGVAVVGVRLSTLGEADVGASDGVAVSGTACGLGVGVAEGTACGCEVG